MEEKENTKAKARNVVTVYRDWCKRCYICVSFCPREALRIDEKGYPVGDPDRCIGCGACEIRCPDFAINLQKVSDSEEEIEDANHSENNSEEEQKSEENG